METSTSLGSVDESKESRETVLAMSSSAVKSSMLKTLFDTSSKGEGDSNIEAINVGKEVPEQPVDKSCALAQFLKKLRFDDARPVTIEVLLTLNGATEEVVGVHGGFESAEALLKMLQKFGDFSSGCKVGLRIKCPTLSALGLYVHHMYSTPLDSMTYEIILA
ncbi:hypothetical protein CFOL_v3_32126 [Cephalotus follicularis]|uniref:Uncharacterized protein n=1 Tax=Cephalotus follicularis TaxID=3775 RepID=A0A1Q3D8C1_CEPFO|nr:hypothetical protein CFOL_v3_32126 [Cephalotus follicularis]